MKTTALAVALLMSGAAIAQTTTDADPALDIGVQTDITATGDLAADPALPESTDPSAIDSTLATDPAPAADAYAATGPAPAGGEMVQPGNENPERDARGIAVLSDPAVVPAGFNGTATTGVGGPLVDPANGETVETADADYPACSRTVTDNCLQTYERGRA